MTAEAAVAGEHLVIVADVPAVVPMNEMVVGNVEATTPQVEMMIVTDEVPGLMMEIVDFQVGTATVVLATHEDAVTIVAGETAADVKPEVFNAKTGLMIVVHSDSIDPETSHLHSQWAHQMG